MDVFKLRVFNVVVGLWGIYVLLFVDLISLVFWFGDFDDVVIIIWFGNVVDIVVLEVWFDVCEKILWKM